MLSQITNELTNYATTSTADATNEAVFRKLLDPEGKQNINVVFNHLPGDDNTLDIAALANINVIQGDSDPK